MFGGKKRREEQIERLRSAVEGAEEALSGGSGRSLELVLAELSDAMLHAPVSRTDIEHYDAELDALRRRGWEAREKLEGEAQDRRDRRVTPCPRCGGREILVSDASAAVELYVANRRTDLRLDFWICRACGDVRLTAPDPAALAEIAGPGDQPAFRPVIVDPDDRGPYR